MATLRDKVRALLENDSILTGLLPGGIYDASELDQMGLTLEDAPKESDGVRIKPVCVLRWNGSNPFGPAVLPTETKFLSAWLYAHSGYALIESAVARLKILLHRQFLFPTDDTALAYILWVGDLGEFIAEEFGGAAADRVRFQVILYRA